MKKKIRIFLAAMSVVFSAAIAAGKPAEAFDTSVDRSDPHFVTASLLVFGPGEELFSCAGHACIRLECPTYKLDYCFSYESESVSEKVLTFFAGRLKMGMFAIPTEEFFRQYVDAGRGCRQYRLELPSGVKQRLWKILDDKVAEGANLPYDYVRRGCAWSVLGNLRAALAPLRLEAAEWPAKYEKSRREITSSALMEHPWKVFALHAIWGFETDKEVTKIEKVLMPNDLLEFLKGATVGGVPVIRGEGVEILPQKAASKAPAVTPVMAAVLLVLLALVGWRQVAARPASCVGAFPRNARDGWLYLNWLFLAVQFVAGLFFVYLVFFSSLPATDWNWLLIPFNPLPLVFWRWRRWWAWPFVGVLAAWEMAMVFAPHRLTDPAYLVMVLGYVIFYGKVAVTSKQRNAETRGGLGGGEKGS